MKKSIIYFFLVGLISFTGCRKDDNPKIPELTRVPTPLILKDATGDPTISRDNPTAFRGKFTVDVYFKTDVPPQKFDVVAIKNGNKDKVVSIQQNVTTFPATIEITGAQLTTLFNEPIVLGDKFTIGVDVTTRNGQKFEAFPALGAGYGAGVGNQVGASTQVEYAAVCPFNINDFVGNAFIDDPDFWGATYPVTVTLEGTDTYKITGWVQEPTYSILVKVNAAAQTVSIAKQVYGATLPTTSYTNPAVEGTGSIDACNKKISMSIDNTVTQGSFGKATIVLRK